MVGVVMELGLGERGDEFHQRQLVCHNTMDRGLTQLESILD